jgi:hypothetical protein
MNFQARIYMLTALAGAFLRLDAQLPPGPPPFPPPASEPSELAALRQAYLNKALTAGHVLTEQFIVVLGGLEKDLGAAGDYEQALSAQKRRTELAETYKSVIADPSTLAAIVLKPTDARLVGSVNNDRSGGLSGWKSAGSSATWDILRVIPGSYDVLLTYAAESASGLTIGNEYEFLEDSNLSGSAANLRSFQLPTTGSISTFTSVTLPAILLQHTSTRFTLRASRIRGTGSLMTLKEIKLTPSKAATPAVGPPTVTLESAREAYIARVKTTAKPLVDAFLTSLKALESAQVAKQDTDAASATQSEAARASAWIANPIPLTTKASAPAPSPVMENFDELTDARFVPRPTNTGDRFLIQHEGKEILVRLPWISCPPIVPDDVPKLKEHAEYFHISVEDALTIGKEAADFTTAYLSDKPLRLLTKGAKDRDGALFAIVIAPNVGDMGSILVDNGLAAIAKPPARPQDKDKPKREEPFVQILKEREATALKSPILPGAWALATEVPKP